MEGRERKGPNMCQGIGIGEQHGVHDTYHHGGIAGIFVAEGAANAAAFCHVVRCGTHGRSIGLLISILLEI
jgi:hypothetical protein